MKTQQLIERMLGGSQYLWSVLVRQARIESSLLVGLGVILCVVSRYLFAFRDRIERKVPDDLLWLFTALYILVLVSGCILVMYNLDGVLFPEGTAAQWLIQSG